MRLDRAYNMLCTAVPILLGRSSAGFLHRGAALTPRTFEGRLACGACCYVMHYWLQREIGLRTKMMVTRIGRRDHCFLTDGELVIDPTHRQFLRPDKWSDSFLYRGNVSGLRDGCVLDWWTGAEESPVPMDMHRVLEDRVWASRRGALFAKLHDAYV